MTKLLSLQPKLAISPLKLATSRDKPATKRLKVVAFGCKLGPSPSKLAT